GWRCSWRRTWARSRSGGPCSPGSTGGSGSGPVGLDAGVGAVDGSVEAGGSDGEPGGGEHRLEQPAERAELGPEVLGEILTCVAAGRIRRRVVGPAIENGACFRRLESECQIVKAQHPTPPAPRGEPPH